MPQQTNESVIETQITSWENHRAEIGQRMYEEVGITMDNEGNPQDMTLAQIAQQFKDDTQEQKQARYDRLQALKKELFSADKTIMQLKATLKAINPIQGDSIARSINKNMNQSNPTLVQELQDSFREYLRLGIQNPAPYNAMVEEMRDRIFVNAAQDTGTPAEGGHLLTPSISNEIINTLSAYGGIQKMAQYLSTQHGRAMLFPGSKGAAEKGALIAEGATAADDPSDEFVRVQIDAFKYTSKRIIVTNELITDANVSILPWVMAQIVRRIGRIVSEHLTTGDGSSKPQGAVSGLPNGKTAASATTFTNEEILDLIASVDAAYLDPAVDTMGGLFGEIMKRVAGKTGFLMSRAMEIALHKLEDTQGRPLWLPSIREGKPGMLYGYPYECSFEMDAIASGKKPLAFGNWGYYTIRGVNGIRIAAQIDSLAHMDARGFTAFWRCDGDWRIPTNATPFPAKVLTMA